MADRQHAAVGIFAGLYATLARSDDVLEFAQELVDNAVTLFSCDAAGLVVENARGELTVLASTSEEITLIELLQEGGPSSPVEQCVNTGRPVTAALPDDSNEDDPLPRESGEVIDVRSLQCMPLQANGDTRGVLVLLSSDVTELDAEDRALLRALTDIGAVGILRPQAGSAHATRHAAIEHALASRTVIEQAKGAIAYSDRLSPEDAYAELRTQAAHASTPITAYAQSILDARRLT